jgi:hypothetical protein
LNEIPDDPFTREEVSKLKQELNQIGNANFWPGPLAHLVKATTDIEIKVKDLKDNSEGWYGEIQTQKEMLFTGV